jgi:hypothetical protein
MRCIAFFSLILACTSSIAIERSVEIELDSPLVASRGETEISMLDLHGRMMAVPAGDRAGVVSSPERLEKLLQDLLTVHALADRGREAGFADTLDFQTELLYMMTVRLAEKYRENWIAERELENYENQARELFLSNPEQFTRPDTVTFKHILVRDFRDDPRARAAALMERLEQGEDFATLARSASDDPSVVQNKGHLAGIDVTTLEQQFAAGIAQLDEGEMGLVESGFGWHVVLVEDRAAGGPQTFEEVRDQLTAQARERHRDRLLDRLMRELMSGELELADGAVAEILERYPPPQELIDAIQSGN